MQARTTRSAIDKKTGRQQVFVCLLLFPFVLFTLSGFTFIPKPAQTPKQATETTLLSSPQQRDFQMSILLSSASTDESCSDIVYPDRISGQEIRIYFNNCALQHLSALISSAGASGAVLSFISLWCEECAPIAAGITAIAAIITANIDYWQYASQGCGGAFLDISWGEGIKFEPACGIQARRS